MKKNYQSDFKLMEVSDVTLTVPFRFTYILRDKEVLVAEFDGTNYTNCRPIDKGYLMVFKCPDGGWGAGSRGWDIGFHLMVRRDYYLTDLDFADGICHESSYTSAGVEFVKGVSDDFDEVVVPYPNYQKGDKGDALTWDTMSQADKDKLKADVIAAVESEMITSVKIDNIKI